MCALGEGRESEYQTLEQFQHDGDEYGSDERLVLCLSAGCDVLHKGHEVGLIAVQVDE